MFFSLLKQPIFRLAVFWGISSARLRDFWSTTWYLPRIYVSPNPPSSLALPVWWIRSNYPRDSFLKKKGSISPARSKVRSRGIIDDLPGQTLSYLSPPDLSSAIIHHKLKLYSGGVALAPLSAQPFVQRSSPPLRLEPSEGAALKPAVQHLCCSGQMVITESICQTQAPSLVANRHLLLPSCSPCFIIFICCPLISLNILCLFSRLRPSKPLHGTN